MSFKIFYLIDKCLVKFGNLRVVLCFFLSLMGICEALSSCFIMSLLTTVSDCIDEVMADTEQQCFVKMHHPNKGPNRM